MEESELQRLEPHTAVIERADTVTEMKEVKQTFRQGIEPQKGMDY